MHVNRRETSREPHRTRVSREVLKLRKTFARYVNINLNFRFEKIVFVVVRNITLTIVYQAEEDFNLINTRAFVGNKGKFLKVIVLPTD